MKKGILFVLQILFAVIEGVLVASLITFVCNFVGRPHKTIKAIHYYGAEIIHPELKVQRKRESDYNADRKFDIAFDAISYLRSVQMLGVEYRFLGSDLIITDDNLTLQHAFELESRGYIDALKNAGCKRVILETGDGDLIY